MPRNNPSYHSSEMTTDFGIVFRRIMTKTNIGNLAVPIGYLDMDQIGSKIRNIDSKMCIGIDHRKSIQRCDLQILRQMALTQFPYFT